MCGAHKCGKGVGEGGDNGAHLQRGGFGSGGSLDSRSPLMVFSA